METTCWLLTKPHPDFKTLGLQVVSHRALLLCVRLGLHTFLPVLQGGTFPAVPSLICNEILLVSP
jgi:hypothetical protein